MSEERVRAIVRQFPENGLKQVLTNPDNVRDLLTLAGATVLPRIDFVGMEVDQTTYITAEYRHVSSDLVLRVKLRPTGKGRRRSTLTLTILVELQQQQDRLMMLRVLEYLVQIWKQQVKQHGLKYGSLANVKLQPVLPLVLHTGSYAWETLGSLLDLMDEAQIFREVTPEFKPLFVSLPDVAEADLLSGGGYLGQVLALLKARQTKQAAFAQRLHQTVAKVQELKGSERLRRLELLSYVEALVYHSRQASEHPTLRQRIDNALANDETRLEVQMVRRTMADVHREEITQTVTQTVTQSVTLAERKRILVEQLRLRWAPLPTEVEQVIEQTQDLDRLDTWLHRFATAKDLDAVGIVPPR